jgi:tRNA pseudouridine32 synthase / 23S rRNA pseudouridine746 synthase
VKFEKHFEVDSTNKTAVDILGESTELTRQAIKQAMNKGAVWLTRNKSTQRIRRADKPLKPGDELHLYFDQAVLEQPPEAATLIADEGLYSIWHKPYGMLSQGSKWGDHCTINRWVEKNLEPQRPAFIVHRLDRAATGLIIIAHQKKIAGYFSNLFQNRNIEKKYQAIVEGEFPDELRLNSEIGDKPALSQAKAIAYNPATNQSLVDVTIETGRKHQIRRHLSEAGFPIVGDRLYGQCNENTSDLCLVSCYLSFASPTDGLNKSYQLPDNLRLQFKH